MNDKDYELRVEDVKNRAHGRWNEILRACGVDERILRHKNLPCPLCGGTDRFQYTDRYGEGNYHCRNRDCGPGGGFKLLRAIMGWDFFTTLKKVNECVGGLPAGAAPRSTANSDERMTLLARRIWNEALAVRPGDEVDRYLSGRGLGMDVYPSALRYHPRLGYYERGEDGKSRRVADYPGMLARIDGPDGQLISLHRTYLSGGRKAELPDAKKVLSPGINGGAIRLFAPTDVLGLSEGIENGLAVHLFRDVPMWSGLNAGNLEKIWLPDTVRHLLIFGDNDADADFDGEASAFALARRVRKEARHGIERTVEVFIPRKNGFDWADVWWAVVNKMKRAA